MKPNPNCFDSEGYLIGIEGSNTGKYNVEDKEVMLEAKAYDRHQNDLISINMATGQSFLDQQFFDVSLERLYTLTYSSNYAIYDKYCAVVMSAGDAMQSQKP